VAHGCQAGLQQEGCDKVYFARIQRGQEFYSTEKLGAFGSDLGAVACFFEPPWKRVTPSVTESDQAWLLNQAAFGLRALGRLNEALEPMRASLEAYKQQEDWLRAATDASNLSELELTLGEVAEAAGDAKQSVIYADRSGAAFQRIVSRAKVGVILYQAGRHAEAGEQFREAEQMQAETQTAYPLLYSLQGFNYCDLLLTEAERAAWHAILECSRKQGREGALDSMTVVKNPAKVLSPLRSASALQSCRAVSERVAQTLDWAVNDFNFGLLSIALDHLTLGRAALYAAVLSSDGPLSFVVAPGDEVHFSAEESLRSTPTFHLESAVSGLRRAGTAHHLPGALLTRAWLRSLIGTPTRPESAQSNLDEAWEIAERGPMKLHMADIHLYRARLFHAVKPYPWTSPRDDLAAARKLIETCGYWRRKEELEDAEAAAKDW
jgi:tetratricopeptide (TPR) repeat protein